MISFLVAAGDGIFCWPFLLYAVTVSLKDIALFISHKKTNAPKKKYFNIYQYERDLIQLSFKVHKLRNGH